MKILQFKEIGRSWTNVLYRYPSGKTEYVDDSMCRFVSLEKAKKTSEKTKPKECKHKRRNLLSKILKKIK